MPDGVNPQVQLAPPSARPNAVFLIEPFALAVNLQTRAVDKKMQWLRTAKPLAQDCQATTATAQGRMIGDGDIDPEHIRDRMQKTFGLTQRLAEHQTKREAGLDGDRRIDWLTAPLSGRRRMPYRHGLRGEPHRQASPSNQRGIVFRPVRHPVSGLGKLVATVFGELVRHEFSQPAGWDGQPILQSGRLPATLQALTVGANGPPLGNVSGLLQPPVYPCTNAVQPRRLTCVSPSSLNPF